MIVTHINLNGEFFKVEELVHFDELEEGEIFEFENEQWRVDSIEEGSGDDEGRIIANVFPHVDVPSILLTQDDINKIYRFGYKAGLTSCAIWKDGKQYVGVRETELKDAIRGIPIAYNHCPPTIDELKKSSPRARGG